MKRRLFALVLLIVVIGITLNGCGCFMQAKKGETPPPAAPAPVSSRLLRALHARLR